MAKRERERRKVRSARERAEKRASEFGSTTLRIPEGVKLLKLTPGVMYLDIIPYAAGKGNPNADEGELAFERTYYVHRAVGAGGDSHICLKKTAGKACPICEQRQKLSRDPDADEDVIKDMAPRERQLFNVINTKDREAGIQILDCSYFLFGKQLDQRILSDEDGEGWDMFHDIENGLTLRLTVVEETFGGNTFPKVTAIDFKKRKEAYEDSIIDEAHCLDDLLKLEEYKKLKAILEEVDADDDDDDDDEKPAKKKAGSKSSSKDDDDDDSSDDDDDDEKPVKKKSSKLADDDDDEDEKPVKKSKKLADDDDDDSSDDDDDDEKPVKKSAKKKPADDDDDDDSSDDDDDDEKPVKKKASKKSDDDDDDSSDDDDDSPDDDDDDEKPAKKKSSKDEDDDDDSWDDDDDDEKPAKKKAKK